MAQMEAVRARLRAAAAYLAELPDEDFTMACYSLNSETPESLLASPAPPCGCVVGHIPRIDPSFTQALVEEADTARPGRPLDWDELARGFAGCDTAYPDPRECTLLDWLFDETWSLVDDTREGTVRRIEVALESGVPAAFASDGEPSTKFYAGETDGAPPTQELPQ